MVIKNYIFILLCFASPYIYAQLIDLNNYPLDSINQFNEIGRHGLFIESCTHLLEDNRTSIGFYVNEKREGIWMVTNAKKTKSRILIDATFKNDKMNGILNVYKKGKLSEQHHFMDNKLNGYSHFYSKSGHLVGIAHFLNDKMIEIIFDKRLEKYARLVKGKGYFIPHCF